MTDSPTPSPPSANASPLSAEARRVLGVLVEKAKTTPDSYPLTVSAVISGSNQKSNRAPQMSLDETDALNALDELRGLGAVREIQGSGRATKYRHAMYEWMDIESAESAIMTELLLRGPQTLGELRTRASRMYRFDDLKAVKAVINQLSEKSLAGAVTPPGRGQMFAHFLYPPSEQQHVQAKAEKLSTAGEATTGQTVTGQTVAGQTVTGATKSTANTSQTAVDQLLDRLDKVNSRIDDLEKRLAQLES